MISQTELELRTLGGRDSPLTLPCFFSHSPTIGVRKLGVPRCHLSLGQRGDDSFVADKVGDAGDDAASDEVKGGAQRLEPVSEGFSGDANRFTFPDWRAHGCGVRSVGEGAKSERGRHQTNIFLHASQEKIKGRSLETSASPGAFPSSSQQAGACPHRSAVPGRTLCEVLRACHLSSLIRRRTHPRCPHPHSPLCVRPLSSPPLLRSSERSSVQVLLISRAWVSG